MGEDLGYRGTKQIEIGESFEYKPLYLIEVKEQTHDVVLFLL